MAPPALIQDIIQQHLTTIVQALAQPQEKSDNSEEHNPLSRVHEEINPDVIELLPEFSGEQSAEELLDWIVTVEETLEFKRVSLQRCVPMIAMRFRGSAAAWWSQQKSSRAREGKPRILSWDKLKKRMRKAFLPFNYEQVMFQRFHGLQQERRSVEEYSTEFISLLRRVDAQYTDQQIVGFFVGGLRQKEMKDGLSLLNPLTLAEAHQKALIVEAHLKKEDLRNFLSYIGSWSLFFISLISLASR